MALYVDSYNTDPNQNNSAPPIGAPEGMLGEDVNDTMRVMMASQRETYDGELAVLANMPGGASLETPVALPSASWVGPRGYIDGFELTWVDADQVIFMEGEAQAQDRSGIFGSNNTVQKSLATVWAEGSSQGGRPSLVARGSANWWHCFRLFNPVNGNVDAGYDTDITAVNLLADTAVVASGYTKARRVGSVADGIARQQIAEFIQRGNWFYWQERKIDLENAAQGDSGTLRAVSVPDGVVCKYNGIMAFNNTSAANAYVYISCPDVSDLIAASPYAGQDRNLGPANNPQTHSQFMVLTDKLAQIRTTANAVDTVLTLLCIGYEDPRGRDGQP